jgi:putative transposase
VFSSEYRRRLPHLQPDFKIFFITFCTYQRWILRPAARTIVVDSCVAGSGLRFELHGLVVMPDHVHLALTPLCRVEGPVPIPEITQAIKGASAHRINKLLNRRGKVWQEESFDRALRREEQVMEKLQYMMENPVRAGLVSNPLDYPWICRAP